MGHLRITLFRSVVALALFSSVLMAILTFTNSFLGPDYSAQRFNRIHINLALAFAAALGSVTLSKENRVWTWCAISSGLLFGFWMYVRVVSSAV
jgi:hypothetical protein